MATKTEKATEISVVKLDMGRFTCAVLGQTPLILNRMSEKAKRALLNPPARKNRVERETTLKHDPFAEFQASAYLDRDEKGATYLQHLASAFHNALAGAALDMPGAAKTQIGRLTWVEGERVAIYGVPKLFMAVTRSADIKKTPDIRTRAIVPQWACYLTVSFMRPLLRDETVANLLAAAGRIQGVGDWRNEKGKGTYGQFALVSEDDPDFKRIVKSGGRAAQVKAMEAAEPYDDESAELLSWWSSETKRRGMKAA